MPEVQVELVGASPWDFESIFVDIESNSIDFLEGLLSANHGEEKQTLLDRVQSVVDALPEREADFVELYFFRHLTQTEIAGVFRVSQPTVCYRLQRATDRIRFVLSLPNISSADIRRGVGSYLKDPDDLEIMVKMVETTCQSAVAKQLGVSQGLVRHRFMRTIKYLEGFEELRPFVDLFRKVSKNLNKLREVRRSTDLGYITTLVD